MQTIVDALSHGGLAPDTPAAVIMSATMANERIVISRLDRLVDDVLAIGLGLPGLIVIGDIVAAREMLLQRATEFGIAP